MLLLFGLLHLFHHKRRTGSIILGMAILLYLVSNGWIANGLLHSLEYRYRPSLKPQGDVIVVLGGGATLDTPNLSFKGHLSGPASNRLLTALQIYHRLKLPLLVCGGKVYQNTGTEADIAGKVLISAGIPGDNIIQENKSRTTLENARFTRVLIDRYHYRRPILVTSAFHMPRAVRDFTRSGMKVIPFPTDYLTNQASHMDWVELWPTAEGLFRTQLALKEYLALLF